MIAVPVAALMTLVLALVPQGAPRWVVPAFIVSTVVLAGHEGAVVVCVKEA